MMRKSHIIKPLKPISNILKFATESSNKKLTTLPVTSRLPAIRHKTLPCYYIADKLPMIISKPFSNLDLVLTMQSKHLENSKK